MALRKGQTNSGSFKPKDPRLYKGKKRLMNGTAGLLGITEEKYEEMLIIQGGVCAICGFPPKKIRLAVDHDHKTNKIRGLLCFRCNYGLGWWSNNSDRLITAATYLEKYRAT